MNEESSGSRGQIIVIFAGGIVALLAISALVIDLGFTFMLRRQEQNATDPAAIAAARYIRPSVNLSGMWSVACFYALNNGFLPTQVGGPYNGIPCDASQPVDGSKLAVNYPPSSSGGVYAGRDGFVEVVLSRPQNTFLAGIIGLPTINVAANAVAAFSSGDSNNNSLIALDPTADCATGNIHGTGGGILKVQVGGNVHVNSKCPTVPPPTTGSCLASGSAGLVVSGTNASLTTPGQAYVSGECAINGSGATITTGAPSNGVNQGAVQIGDPLGELRAPPINTAVSGQSCGGGQTTDAGTHNAGCGSGGLPWVGTACGSGVTCVTLNPGVYYGGWSVGSKTKLMLNPGIYVIAGGGINQTSTGAIDAVTDVNGNPGHVMIYSTDNPAFAAGCAATYTNDYRCQGKLTFTAQSTVKAYGIDQATCASISSTCPYVGMFMWQDGRASCPTMSCPITVGGSTTLEIAGTIYAPTQQVKVDGGALAGNDGTATVQIIAWQWDIGGNGNLIMPYDPTQLYHLDQKGLVH